MLRQALYDLAALEGILDDGLTPVGDYVPIANAVGKSRTARARIEEFMESNDMEVPR
jgi:hypothetical protein